MLRQSLKELLVRDGLKLGLKWAEMRPEALKPFQFIELVIDLYGKQNVLSSPGSNTDIVPSVVSTVVNRRIWRPMKKNTEVNENAENDVVDRVTN